MTQRLLGRSILNVSALALAVAGAAAVGVMAGISPLVAAGIIGFVLLLLLPMNVLLVGFVVVSIFSLGHGFSVGPFSVLPGQMLLVPLAVRVFLLSGRGGQRRWAWPEWLLLAWLGLQFLTSYFNAPNPKASLIVAAQLTLAGGAYLTIYTVTDSRHRLILVARAILIAATLNALIGLVATVGHAAHIGAFNAFMAGRLAGRKGVGSIPKGLSVENNIYGSTSGAAALALFVLMRERNEVFSRRIAIAGFWICLAATVASATRGAWIGFGFGLIALFVLGRGRARRRSAGVQPAVVLVMVGVLAGAGIWLSTRPTSPTPTVSKTQGSVTESASELFNFGGGTGAHRLSEWKLALDDLSRSPIFGIGTNSYGQLHLDQAASPKNPKPGYLGNVYVRTLHDSGLVGFAMFLMFLGAAAWPRPFLQRSSGELAAVARAFIFGYIVLAVAYAATDASFQPWPWIILGCARAATLIARRQALSERPAAATDPALPA